MPQLAKNKPDNVDQAKELYSNELTLEERSVDQKYIQSVEAGANLFEIEL